MTNKEIELLKNALKIELRAEIAAELKPVMKAELLKELNSKAGYITRLLPNTTSLYCVVRLDEHGNEIQIFAGQYGSEWLLEGAKQIAEQLRAATVNGILQQGTRLQTNHYKGYIEPVKKTADNHFGIQ